MPARREPERIGPTLSMAISTRSTKQAWKDRSTRTGQGTELWLVRDLVLSQTRSSSHVPRLVPYAGFNSNTVNSSVEGTNPAMNSEESKGALTTQWSVERTTSLLAGSIVLFSLGMAKVHSNRWRFLTGFVGVNLLMNAVIGWCPTSLALRRLGLPTAAQCARR